ncbi:hypothetical protein B0H66DRAFT_607867 [Apodospora peruviana]|uniref:Uncharacterized protein n=1 Tax=Apodospora peruviana TaxID=516989 RepID=A0AAE0HUI4_9PEZI|nr:hypothetical protein B0H66DRAFT_607867 [Apodospora peruviana]
MSPEPPLHIGRAAHALRKFVQRGIIAAREDDKECRPGNGANLCEKPAVSSQSSTWIIVGVVIAAVVLGTLAVVLYFHFKNKKKSEREDLEDRFAMADYGLDEAAAANRSSKRKSRQLPQGAGSGQQQQPKLSLDDLRPPPGVANVPGKPKGYVNPFVSEADDAVSIKSIDLHPQWPRKDESSAASSQQHLPPQKL